jgi:hydrogenase maturation protease
LPGADGSRVNWPGTTGAFIQMTLSRLLVIAYGDPLRGDDGLAWHAAEELKQRNFPDVEIMELHQLAPELAETISRSDAVIFVDAAAAAPGTVLAGEIRIVATSAREVGQHSSSPFHHQYSPASLLALAAQLYKARPRAFVASLVGEDFSPGERLSSGVENAMPEFLARIEKLILEVTGSPPEPHRKT